MRKLFAIIVPCSNGPDHFVPLQNLQLHLGENQYSLDPDQLLLAIRLSDGEGAESAEEMSQFPYSVDRANRMAS